MSSMRWISNAQTADLVLDVCKQRPCCPGADMAGSRSDLDSDSCILKMSMSISVIGEDCMRLPSTPVHCIKAETQCTAAAVWNMCFLWTFASAEPLWSTAV